MVTSFDTTTYPQGTNFIFPSLKQAVGSMLSFDSSTIVDMQSYPGLPQPIFIWVRAPRPYALDIAEGREGALSLSGAVKISVAQTPKPGKPYYASGKTAVFWNWPNGTPSKFSALAFRCSPLLLPDKVLRDPIVNGQGLLLDDPSNVFYVSDRSNYLGILGPLPYTDDIWTGAYAFISPSASPAFVGEDYINYGKQFLLAAQYVDQYGLSNVPTSMIRESAPEIGYWLALLPVSIDEDLFMSYVSNDGLLY